MYRTTSCHHEGCDCPPRFAEARMADHADHRLLLVHIIHQIHPYIYIQASQYPFFAMRPRSQALREDRRI